MTRRILWAVLKTAVLVFALAVRLAVSARGSPVPWPLDALLIPLCIAALVLVWLNATRSTDHAG